MPRWLKIFICFAIIGLGACHSSGADTQGLGPGTRSSEKAEKKFQPYSDPVVPKMKDLIRRKGFLAYTSKTPYLLGFSYDGTYLATIVYDKKAKAYRIDIHHTGNNRVEGTVYAPRGEQLSESRDSSSAEEELLKGTQETLDMGYQIKVPVKPREYSLNQTVNMNNKDWAVQLIGKKGAVIHAEDDQGHRWRVSKAPLKSGEKLSSRWLFVIPPTLPEKGSVIAFAHRKEKGLRPLVYTVDTSLLRPDWSEKALSRRVNKYLRGDTQVVYRGMLTDQGPDSVLAVRDAIASSVGPREGVRYRGDVCGFILFDAEGEVLYRGNTAGLVYREQVLSDPSIPKDPETHYRLLLTVQTTDDGNQERVLTVDQLNGEDRIVRTYELLWNEKDQQFEQVGERGTEGS
ncbi:hypothetical protein [Paludifilum halophilum]|uniref:Lipoprotein n=1 Tax=Paludifilum halophilum TaxID=1642702 RepID=A0A235B9J6_9BACL|nr:hypothetical protein [Paludifilum halophilum]OYD08980.1 hypothetical protein CHM34_04175 [Paludifilum halophilum]